MEDRDLDRRFGFNNPILIDSDGGILAGHGRYRAAATLGIKDLPVVQLEHLSPAEKRAFMLADNRTAEDATWEPELLAAELRNLLLLDTDFEITDTGFKMTEIDRLLLGDDCGGRTRSGRRSHRSGNGVAVCAPGRPMGNRRASHFLRRCARSCELRAAACSERADMIFSDPPYSRSIAVVSNMGRKQHAEFAEASGEMSPVEFEQFDDGVRAHGIGVNRRIDPLHLHGLAGSARAAGGGRGQLHELKNLVIWDKGHGGMGSLYRSQHELIAVFKAGTASHHNNIRLGATGRNRTNMWHYAGMSSFHKGRDAALALHPTVKPVALCADAMLDCSARGSIILDPFGGSGTTLIAATRWTPCAADRARPALCRRYATSRAAQRPACCEPVDRRDARSRRNKCHIAQNPGEGRQVSDDGSDDYAVGYGKPPVHSRFKPGNPGRRKGGQPKRVTGEQIVERLLARKTRVKRGDRVVEIGFEETVVSRMHAMLTQGSYRDVAKVLEFVERFMPPQVAEQARLEIVHHRATGSKVALPTALHWDDIK